MKRTPRNPRRKSATKARCAISLRGRFADHSHDPTILDAAEDLLAHLSGSAAFVLGQAREFEIDVRLVEDEPRPVHHAAEFVIAVEKHGLAIALDDEPGDETEICVEALIAWLGYRNNASRMRWALKRERAAARVAKQGEAGA